MTQRAARATTGALPDSADFNQNYKYLKNLIKQFKTENPESIQKELFGEGERKRKITKKEMKEMFRFLRTIEDHYEECRISPVPAELEKSILNKEDEQILPWEQEVVEQADEWRKKLEARKRESGIGNPGSDKKPMPS